MNEMVAGTLIIKIGATGDVVRTTALLHATKGEVHWLTSEYNAAILPRDCSHLTRIFSVEKDLDQLYKYKYDLVLSLDEGAVVKDILPRLQAKRMAGVIMHNNVISYSKEAASWFDMSLISAHDKVYADLLKLENRKTYQELIFAIAGLNFNGQPYWINKPQVVKEACTVGIEKRTGSRWQGKAWWGYDVLSEQLQQKGYLVRMLSQRDTLEEYSKDIGCCNYIITGDTLAMHLALAYEIPVVAIFTCTAPWEIYDYHLLQKVVSPLLKQSFYKPLPVPEAIDAISVDMVMEAFMKTTNMAHAG